MFTAIICIALLALVYLAYVMQGTTKLPVFERFRSVYSRNKYKELYRTRTHIVVDTIEVDQQSGVSETTDTLIDSLDKYHHHRNDISHAGYRSIKTIARW